MPPIGAGCIARGTRPPRWRRSGGRQVLTFAIDDPEWRGESQARAGHGPPARPRQADAHVPGPQAADLSAFAHMSTRCGSAAIRFQQLRCPRCRRASTASMPISCIENGFAPTLVNTIQYPASRLPRRPAMPAGGRTESRVADGDGRRAGPCGSRTPTIRGPRCALPAHRGREATRLPSGTDGPLGAGRSGRRRRGHHATILRDRAGRIAVGARALHGHAEPRRRPAGRRFGVRAPASGRQHQPHRADALSPKRRAQAPDGSRAVGERSAGDAHGGHAVRAVDGGRHGTSPGGAHDAAVHAASPPTNTVTFPFVFPEPGAYRIFVQVKIRSGGRNGCLRRGSRRSRPRLDSGSGREYNP